MAKDNPSQRDRTGEALKYDMEVDLQNKESSQTRLVFLTGRDKDVLEVGPAQGYMTKVLHARGCRVTGIEIDPVAAREAAQYCERMIVGDVERLSFRRTFRKKRFDVVIYGDVLEHLVDPGRVLAETARILKPGGQVLASIPNVAHGSVRLSLLAGQFRYTDTGILDNTHLRFFTKETMKEMFQDAGYRIIKWVPIVVDPFGPDFGLQEQAFPPYLVYSVRQDPDAQALQYVLRAEPDRTARVRRRRRPSAKVSKAVDQLGEHIAWLEKEHTAKDLTIQQRDGMIVERDSIVSDLQQIVGDANMRTIRMESQIAEMDTTIAEKDAAIRDRDNAIADKELRLQESLVLYEQITGSIGYRFLQKMRRWVNRLAPGGSRRRGFVRIVGHGVDVLMREGFLGFLGKFFRVWRWIPGLFRRAPLPAQASEESPGTNPLDEQYRQWLEHQALTTERVAKMRDEVTAFDYNPTLSIVMPVYDTKPEWLTAAIESVMEQVYQNWELCIADDRSPHRGTRKVLRRYIKRDPRVKVTFLKTKQGIAGASNAALGVATGEFVTFLDHDDELKPDALFQVVRLLNEHRNLDFIYSDEDKRNLDGKLVEPFFKPDWSPDLLMSVNFLNHLSVYRKELVDHLGGFRLGYDGSQDYDLALRVSEVTDKIEHITRPLYTWRKAPESAAAGVHAKEFAYRAGKRALKDALARRGFEGEVVPALVPGRYRVRYAIKGEPKVSILIPTRDRLDMLRRCVDSIRQVSTYRNFDVNIIDNRSEDPQMLVYLESFPGRVIRYPEEFNYARIMNVAAREVDGELLLLLNNDTEVIAPEWIEAMIEHAQRSEVAAVGGRLMYPDGRVQHEGIIVGFAGGSAGNVDFGGFQAFGETIRNCSAVTGACMMVRTEVYWELSGFEERLGVAFNDVDFCLRAREKGYEIVYTPYAHLYHHESATRGRLHPESDEQFFRSRWGNPGEYRDPYYNPNLDWRVPFRLSAPSTTKSQ